MPLLHGLSKNIIADNIRELRGSGRPERQAIAIALSTARRKKKQPNALAPMKAANVGQKMHVHQTAPLADED